MKYKIVALWGILSIVSLIANAGEMQAKMVGYKDCHPDLKSLSFEYKPQYCSMSQQSITFMIKGHNIALLDKDSIKLTKLEIDGKDVRYNRKGDNNFKMGSFPKVDDNGEFAVFDMDIESLPFGNISRSSFAGTVDVMTSERMIIKDKKAIDLKKGFLFKLGSLSISDKPITEENAVADSIGNALNKGLKKAFTSGDGNSLTLYVKGDIKSLVGLEVYENGKKVDQGWSSYSDDEKSIYFNKPSGSIVDIKVKYWDKLKRVTVPIN